MKMVYVAGPYRSYNKDGSLKFWGVKANIDAAWQAGHEVWRAGAVPYIPHKNSEMMDGDGIPAEQFLKGDIEVLRRCDAIYAIPGWLHSEGAKAEVQFAEQHGLKVFLDMPSLTAWIREG